MEKVVRGLFKILLGGFAAFMILAIAQEWSFFSSAWFGDESGDVAEVSQEEQDEAVDALRSVFALMRHFYASGGDPRFADRMPASQGVIEEMMEDIAYLRRNHRVQEPGLLRLEVLGVERFGERDLEIRTREFWRADFSWITGNEPVEPPRSYIVYGRYLLIREDSGWRVDAWDLADPETDVEAGSS